MPEAPLITKVSVRLTRKIDLGYEPYMEYLQSLGNRAPAFGTRDQSNTELSAYVEASFPILTLLTEDERIAYIRSLVEKADIEINSFLKARGLVVAIGSDEFVYEPVPDKSKEKEW